MSKTAWSIGALALALLAVPAGSQEGRPAREVSYRVMTPETVIQDWPQRPRLIARAMIEKYGEPNEFDDKALSWKNNGPWKKTIVNRYPIRVGMARVNNGLLFQSISYLVPPGRYDDLLRFNSQIIVDRGGGELACRSDSEKTNFLTINLADEILMGRRSVTQARRFYEHVSRLTQAGKESDYTRGIIRQKELEQLQP